MPIASIRMEFYAKWSREDPQVLCAALSRDDVEFAFLPRAADHLMVHNHPFVYGISWRYVVAFVEHSLAGEKDGTTLKGESCIVCQGPWPPAEGDSEALDALFEYEAKGWEIVYLNDEVRFRLEERRDI